MITYTVYSEGGGVGKTTIAANLAHAHQRMGQNVLLVDIDQQDASLTQLLGVEYEDATNADADDLVMHMIGRPKGEFDDLIYETDEGMDIIPAHNRLSDFQDLLDNAEEFHNRTETGEFNRYNCLFEVLRDNGAHNEYDVLIIDPNAKADELTYNAIYATRSIVMPVEPSGKGALSVNGLRDIVDGIEGELDIEVGVPAAIPNNVGNTNDEADYVENLRATKYRVPIVFNERRSLLKGCWSEQTTAFSYVENHRDRERQRELDTLEKYEELAAYITEDATSDSDSDAAQGQKAASKGGA